MTYVIEAMYMRFQVFVFTKIDVLSFRNKKYLNNFQVNISNVPESLEFSLFG